MSWRNIRLILNREISDQLRDRRTIFMVVILPLLLYPALGIGTLQMSLLFSEQPRTVVMLGADSLPNPPALLTPTGSAINEQWFAVATDSEKINFISDKTVVIQETPAENESRSEESQTVASPTETDTEERLAILKVAGEIRLRYQELSRLKEEILQADDQPEENVVQVKQEQIASLKEQISKLFSVGNIQVLIIIPDGFDEYVKQENERILSRDAQPEVPEKKLNPIIIRNTANEKSSLAYGPIIEAFDSWEQMILNQRLEMANLPADIVSPVNTETLDLAKGSELAANIWSKLFPAMLVLMAMTGAFYPAVDLGAGEKERGTMETLLICPALRSEIVIGKFLTVMLFSLVTAVLNIAIMGATGLHMLNSASNGQLSQMGDFTLPGIESLIWLAILAIPLAALFSALSLSFALFAKSSKEGQYYLTPLLTVTMGLTIFCISPAVEITPFYSLVPVMGPALLLKGVLLGSAGPEGVLWYIVPVLSTSFLYSGLALAWAIDQFQREEVLFREAERFDLRLWLKHLLRDKESTPNFMEAGFCFFLIMFLQFALLKVFGAELQNAPDTEKGITMIRLLIVQQLVIIACPALFMGLILTSNPLKTFQFKMPQAKYLVWGLLLPVILHPVIVELATNLSWFFPPLPDRAKAAMAVMGNGSIHWSILLLGFAVAPAICEEIAFRGFILSGFRKRGRDGLAIILSSLLFGVMHMIPQQVFNAALVGLVIGLLAVRSGSIFPCMLFHFGNNAIAVLHGNLVEFRERSSVIKNLTLLDGNELHYPLWIVGICFIASAYVIFLLFKSKQEAAVEHAPRPVQ